LYIRRSGLLLGSMKPTSGWFYVAYFWFVPWIHEADFWFVPCSVLLVCSMKRTSGLFHEADFWFVPWSGLQIRPSTPSTNGYLGKGSVSRTIVIMERQMEALVDRRLTVGIFSTMFDISYGMVQLILTKVFKMKNGFVHWQVLVLNCTNYFTINMCYKLKQISMF
jgi:hypothetical protein